MTIVDRRTYEIKLNIPMNNAELMTKAQLQLESQPIQCTVFRFSYRHGFDMGAWCYSRHWGNKLIKNVDPESQLMHRLVPLKNLASQIITLGMTRLSLLTCHSKLGDWGGLMQWAERNQMTELLRSPSDYHQALQQFSHNLTNDPRSVITKKRVRSSCIEFGEYLFPDDSFDFNASVQPINSSRNKKQISLEPPSENEMTRFLSITESLFTELTKFLLTDQKFPYLMPIENESVWLVTEERPYVSASVLAKGHARTAGTVVFDYTTGLPRPWESYVAHAKRPTSSHYKSSIKDYEIRLEAANDDPYHFTRVRLARIAHDCFVAMFTAASGLNESPIRNLPWSNKIEIASEKSGLRTIKIRALNKTVNFDVKPNFLKYLKLYFKLRDYLCKNTAHEYLFIGFTGDKASNFRMLDSNILRRLNDRIRRSTDPEFPRLSYKKLRDYKENYTVTKHGAEAARHILQHSSSTQRKHYLKSNEKTAVDKIGAFFQEANKFFSEPYPVATPAGGCANEGSPDGNISTGQVPDCKNSIGCLNCKNFKVHADQNDAWKLISMEYVIRELISCCKNKEHFDETHGADLSRINKILTKMVTINPDMKETIDTLRVEVYEQDNLTDYWQRHLERLVKLGIIK